MSFGFFSSSIQNSTKKAKNLRKSMVLALSMSIAIPLIGTQSAQAAGPTLINYYQFEGNGVDSAGGQNATVVGSAGFSAGKYGNGYSSVGGNGSYLDMGPNVGLFGASDFTLGFWFQSAGGSGHFINKRLDSLHFITFQMSPTGQIGLELRGGSGGTVFRNLLSAQSGLNDGAWHHMAVVRFGSTLYLYVDGQVSATDSGASGLDFNDPNYNGANFIFGGTNQYPGLSFAGSLDDLQIYNGALTQSQVNVSMITPFVAPTLLVQASVVLANASSVVGTALTAAATGGSGTGSFSYSVTNGTSTTCSIVGSSVNTTSAGTCLVQAIKAADSTYLASTPVTATFTFTTKKSSEDEKEKKEKKDKKDKKDKKEKSDEKDEKENR